jgi:hypothetical protein
LNFGFEVNDLRKISHNLKTLFLKLPSDKQKGISNWMKCFYQQNILELLDNIKDDFVNLRYMYLEDNIKKFDLYLIVQFTYKMQYEASMEVLGYDIKKQN